MIYLVIFFISLFIGNIFTIFSMRLLYSTTGYSKYNLKLKLEYLIPLLNFKNIEKLDKEINGKLRKSLILSYFLIFLSLIVFKHHINDENIVIYTILLCCLIISSITDIIDRVMEVKSFTLVSVIVLLIRIFNFKESSYYFISVFILFILFYLLYIVTKGKSIGGGDIKLILLIGLSLGIEKTLISLFISSLIAFVCLLPLIINNKADLYTEIPFIPYITLGIIINYYI